MVTKTLHSKEEISALLAAIKDPEIPVLSISEMGILRDIVVTDDHCEVIITPTYSGCPAMGIIEQDILATLHHHGIPNPSVKLVYAPAWTTDTMSAEAREKLRLYGIAAPVHSSCRKAGSMEARNIECPRCGTTDTMLIAQFGSTACKALYQCRVCLEPFDYFKCH